jgi:hypothetical protein
MVLTNASSSIFYKKKEKEEYKKKMEEQKFKVDIGDILIYNEECITKYSIKVNHYRLCLIIKNNPVLIHFDGSERLSDSFRCVNGNYFIIGSLSKKYRKKQNINEISAFTKNDERATLGDLIISPKRERLLLTKITTILNNYCPKNYIYNFTDNSMVLCPFQKIESNIHLNTYLLEDGYKSILNLKELICK